MHKHVHVLKGGGHTRERVHTIVFLFPVKQDKKGRENEFLAYYFAELKPFKEIPIITTTTQAACPSMQSPMRLRSKFQIYAVKFT